VGFTVVDVGPGESPHDSLWLLDTTGDEAPHVFAGDVLYDHQHAYLADGFADHWLSNLDRLERELPSNAVVCVGHGSPTTMATVEWQRQYLQLVFDAVKRADWIDPDRARAEVLEEMTAYLPDQSIRFLLELSLDAIRPRRHGS
jgi:glyoxylase-like metal-dependent hydrolase (beta-lactamase superfamily II)